MQSPLELVLQAGVVVQFVMLLLLAASVVCWAIIGTKFKLFRKVESENAKFLATFWNSKNLEDIYSQTDDSTPAPVGVVFRSGFRELQKLSTTERTHAGQAEVENIGRALTRASQSQITALEQHLGLLATTASAAPFVGLFGTVWGIMNAFQRIGSSGSANLAVVAPAISEALIATAVGLAAAIPAVVAYNGFVNKIKKQSVDMDCFAQDFLNIIQRGLLSEAKPGAQTATNAGQMGANP